eukprot:UN12645
MGNVLGAAGGAGIGALVGGPVGIVIGFAVGGATGMVAEIANDNMTSDISSANVQKIYVRKSDLLWTGLNTIGASARFILAPASTLAKNNKTFWIEHWWIVLELQDNKGYITSWKGPEGVCVVFNKSWYGANTESQNGMGSSSNKNVSTVKYYSGTRTVQECINKIRNTHTYWALNGDNCQDYADEIYSWY